MAIMPDMDEERRSELFAIVDGVHNGDEPYISSLTRPDDISFADFVRKRRAHLFKHIRKSKCTCQGYIVALPTYPPLGSPIEKNHLVNLYTHMQDPISQFYLTVAISYNCSSQCPHCYISEYVNNSRSELTVPEFNVAFNKIVDDLQVWHLDLTGGEPIEHPQFFDIINQVPRDKATVMLATNAIHISEKNITRFRDANVMVYKVSLGAYRRYFDPELNYKSLEQTIRAIRLLRSIEKFILVQIYVERGCHSDTRLESLIRKCREWDVQAIHLITPLTVGRLKNRSELYLSHDDRAYLYQLKMKYDSNHFFVSIFPDWELEGAKLGRGCLAGRGRIYISAYGDVYPCNMLPNRYGNILTDDIRSIVTKIHRDYPQHPKTCISSNITPEEIQRLRVQTRGITQEILL
jgi:MoaA/NifB/PqqE/SkfB family radical SAM enzyme